MNQEPTLHITWLYNIGFRLGNPFTTREASGEPSSALVQYFVLRPGFADIVGSALYPRSALLCARRGAGKTTSRLALELQCRAGQMDAPVLPLPYTDFERPLLAAGGPAHVALAHHLAEIMRVGLRALLQSLAERPGRTARFVGSSRRQLAAYLAHYSDLFDDMTLDNWLAEQQLLSEACHAEALRGGRVPANAPFPAFLAELLELGRDAPPPAATPTEQFSALLGLARYAGYEAVYVLVDRIDEREPMAGDPEQAAALLAPLVSDLILMDKKHTAFKFFITPEVLAVLSARLGDAFRPDRLIVRDISWDKAGLKELLDRRVAVFSEGLLPTLDAVAETGDVVSRLATAADGSPRNMLRLAEWLLFHQHQRAGPREAFMLTVGDVEEAVISFGRERAAFVAAPPASPALAAAPIIRIDEAGAVWVGNQPIGQLPKMRRRLLAYLLENEGRVLTYEQIGRRLYAQDWTLKGMTNDSVDGLVKHIRKTLALGSAGRTIIRKVPDEGGYVFQQPRAGQTEP